MKNMKIYRPKQLFACTLLLLCSIQTKCVAQSVPEQIRTFAAEGSISNLSAVKVAVESLWPKDSTLYFQSNNQLETVLETLAKTNVVALQELVEQARLALSRRCPTNPTSAADCFKGKLQIAERLIRSSSTSSISNALALAEFLGEVRTTIITNYERKLVVFNVTPPIIPTNSRMGVFSGMDPKAISDPTAKAAYEKAIAENGERGGENDLQLNLLPETNQTLTPFFLVYAKAVLARIPEPKEMANLLSALAHLTQEERQQLQ